MKKAKKLFAMLLAMVMVLAMALPVCASEVPDEGATTPTAATGSITIHSADKSNQHQFYAYQIFKGTLSADEKTLSDVEWGNGVSTNTTVDGKNLLEAIRGIGTDTPFADCEDAADVAQALSGYADKSAMAETFAETVRQYLSTESTSIAWTNTDGIYFAEGLDVGYYLIVDRLEDEDIKASDLLLKLVGKVTIDAKVDMATVSKYAGEEALTDNTAYGVGDIVTYTLTGTLPADFDAENAHGYVYKFVDTMENELALANVQYEHNTTDGGATSKISSGVTVKLGETDVTDAFDITYENNVLTVAVKITEDGKGLERLAGITKDSKITVTYDAEILSMPSDSDGISNKVNLTYHVDTEAHEYTETVFPVNLTVEKVDGTDKSRLTGAVFQLSRVDNSNGGNTKEYLSISADNVMSWVTDADDATTRLSTVDGLISLKGLPLGTYTLTELEAPDGYNKLDGDVELVIGGTVERNTTGALELKNLSIKAEGGNGTVENDTSTVTITIENNKGTTLPSTGGIGTTIFYIIGGILMVGAVVLLVTRRRMSEEQ